MATDFSKYQATRTGTRDQAMLDEGLRSYMLKVYNYMASGLALSGIAAALTASTPAVYNAVFGTPLQWVVMLAPIGLLLAMSRTSASTTKVLYWIMVATFGVSISYIFQVYTAESVVRVFFITAATFGAASLYGYVTKRDLTGFGSFLFMGLIGIFIAMVVNIFLASTMMHFVISVLGVLIFTGLTAFDTQRIKSEYYHGHSQEVMEKGAVMGAVSMYLNFLNLFMFLLSLLGNRN
ncbi:BAX inhibitor (BI)-1/YccA family protein [Sneathiella chungangensis]|uniref:BAX inhibitor (BI)-1/YccA family protein n=1 Tax=Sneathiella chungangensis TaxID=1418234 RepID=A0A845MIB3_9PROT|nr:Bax inhibitor-1/YccA family protein [Sneathiella chungangensis]MZR23352.1 BAX inhibitor (BI)-1/YccA family protein [Sneathiella chungangensis]